MDFTFDGLASDRRLKTLTVVDEGSKKTVPSAASIPTRYVTRALDQVKRERGLPKRTRTDNGPEFASRAAQHALRGAAPSRAQGKGPARPRP